MSTTSPDTLTFRDGATGASRPAWRELELRFEVITPVFGGGVYIDPASAHVKEIDRRTPVRFSEIRQQLRFWWRACHVHRHQSLSEMREREMLIFGSTKRRGAMTGAVVRQPTSCEDFEIFESHQGAGGRFNPRAIRGYEAIAYGAFPLQHKAGMNSQTENGVLHALSGTVVVKLRVHADDAMLQELRTACSAWLHLGGIGGRTRRGFGAVSPTNPEEWSQFRDDPSGAPRAEELQSVASLHGAARVTSTQNWRTATEALSFGLRRLQTFRQGVEVARARGMNKPSFSWWPEPDELRRLFPAGDYPWELHPVGRFPRAHSACRSFSIFDLYITFLSCKE
ncbi:MAG: type III-B CRISPR module RAMP protein Cmr1 [Gemmatimonadetes bacterium]|nr:type III-B CRISPR module RAMP protein Cmr1 [Gemmatimonadota bacterium]